jgi:hypothetical protein
MPVGWEKLVFQVPITLLVLSEITSTWFSPFMYISPLPESYARVPSHPKFTPLTVATTLLLLSDMTETV